MKKLSLIAMVLCAVALAQPQTFRSMSTGGMIQDDLDRWLSGTLYLQPVPDRLLDVEGVRLYTGLSNLATGSDMVFSEADSTRGGFLLGGSWCPSGVNWGTGLLTEFMEDRIYDEVSLPGPDGMPFLTGEGSIEGTWSQFLDTTGDGVLDTRQTAHQTAVARTDSSLRAAGLFGAYRAGDTVRLGLGLSWEKLSAEVLDGDDNRTVTVSDSNLVTGVETYRFESDMEGLHAEDRTAIVVSASGTGEMTDRLSIGGMFQFASISSEVSLETTDSGTEDFLPDEPLALDVSTWSGSQRFSASPGGSRFGGGLNLEYAIDDDWSVEASGGYYTMSLSGSADEYSVSMDSSYFVTIGSFIDSTIVALDGTGSTDLDMGDDLFALGTKLLFEPSNVLTVSMGAVLFMHDHSFTVTNQAEMTVVETYSDGDEQFADPDDYVSTSTWSQTEETVTTAAATRLAIPIGLEFQVLPRLCGRLGAAPAFVWEKQKETSTLLDASPVVTHTVYGDGTEEQFVESPYEIVDGTLVETESFHTDIPFSYGVGYSPSDHVQIDLMGLGKSFDQWRLSATLLF